MRVIIFAKSTPEADALEDDRAMERYHLLPAVRGDLLAKVGRQAEAAAELERAAALTRNAAERDLLLDRARAATRVAAR